MVSRNNSKKSAFQRLIDWIAIPEETDENTADLSRKNEAIPETGEIGIDDIDRSNSIRTAYTEYSNNCDISDDIDINQNQANARVADINEATANLQQINDICKGENQLIDKSQGEIVGGLSVTEFDNSEEQSKSIIEDQNNLDDAIMQYGELYKRVKILANQVFYKNSERKRTIEYAVKNRKDFDEYKLNFETKAAKDPIFINYLLNTLDYNAIGHETGDNKELNTNLKIFFTAVEKLYGMETNESQIPKTFDVRIFRTREQELADNIINDIKMQPYSFVYIRFIYRSDMDDLELKHTQLVSYSELRWLLQDEERREKKQINTRLNTIVYRALRDFDERYADPDKEIYFYIGFNPFIYSDAYWPMEERTGSRIVKLEKANYSVSVGIDRPDLHFEYWTFIDRLFNKLNEFETSRNLKKWYEPAYELYITSKNPDDFALFSDVSMNKKLHVLAKYNWTDELYISENQKINKKERAILKTLSECNLDDIGLLIIAKFKYNSEIINSFKSLMPIVSYSVKNDDIKELSFHNAEDRISGSDNDSVISSGYDFEEYCATLLTSNGFDDVQVTKGSGDQGIDIIAYRYAVKYGIQCKYYEYPVGNQAIQEAAAGKKYYDCNVAVVATNSTFTKQAKALARKNNVVLWDGEFLKKMRQ